MTDDQKQFMKLIPFVWLLEDSPKVVESCRHETKVAERKVAGRTVSPHGKSESFAIMNIFTDV